MVSFELISQIFLVSSLLTLNKELLTHEFWRHNQYLPKGNQKQNKYKHIKNAAKTTTTTTTKRHFRLSSLFLLNFDEIINLLSFCREGLLEKFAEKASWRRLLEKASWRRLLEKASWRRLLEKASWRRLFLTSKQIFHFFRKG